MAESGGSVADFFTVVAKRGKLVAARVLSVFGGKTGNTPKPGKLLPKRFYRFFQIAVERFGGAAVYFQAWRKT